MTFHLPQLRSKAKDAVYRQWRISSGAWRKAQALSAARHLVTPFSGYMLSNFYLSDEIDGSGLNYLNPQSHNLKSADQPLEDGAVVFIQSDQVEQFVAAVLPRIGPRFFLITGKWHLPSLEITKAVESLSASPKILGWFSQNQVRPDLPIRAFPYGLEPTTAPVVPRLLAATSPHQDIDVLGPHARIHPHFSEEIKEIRSSLAPFMDDEMPIVDYLERIRRSKFVVSPPGDRPDTYRHWEALALGAMPVSNLSGPLRRLFGDNMIFVEDFRDVSRQSFSVSAAPDSSLVLLETWKRRVHESS